MAFTVYNMAVFLGQQLMGEAGTIAASIMEVLMPMVSILIMWIATKNTPKGHTLVTVAVALFGALLVITKGELAFFTEASRHMVPLLLIFIGVIGWVIYSMGGTRFKEWSILRYSTLTCLAGTGLNLVIVTLASSFQLVPVPTWDTMLAIKYEMSFMVVLPGLAALLSWNAGIKLLSPLNGILFINFVPVTTFIIMAFQGYRISLFEIIGTAVIIMALVSNNLMQRQSLRDKGRVRAYTTAAHDL
ncbi:hypothetical protein D3C78_974550 [compost metagenome]